MNRSRSGEKLTIKSAIESGSTNLRHLGNGRLDSELILGHVLNLSRVKLYINLELNLQKNEQKLFKYLIKKRQTGIPTPYLTGTAYFWSMKFLVTQDVLIPRPETEILVENALSLLKNSNDFIVADLGTGSGAISGAIASEFSKARILAIDTSESAIKIAKKNFQRLELDNIDCIVSDWNTALRKSAASLIVANPPYVSCSETNHIDQEILAEPQSSIFARDNGLADIKAIISTSNFSLKKNGYLLIEHGFRQGRDVRNYFLEKGFSSVVTRRDLSGHERVTLGRKN